MDWATEVRPVLDATYRLLATEEHISGDAVIAELGRPHNDPQTGRALKALVDSGYIEGRFVMQTSVPILISATEKGLQETSGWPKPGGGGDQLDLLLRLLDERIAATETPPEEKGRLERVRDSLADAGRDVVVGVLSNFIAKQTGASD